MVETTEPTIVLGYEDFVDRALYEAGWAAVDWSGAVDMTTGENLEIDRCIQDAHRKVLYSVAPYEWSWLRPRISIVLWATTTTGAATASGADPFYLTDAANSPFLPSMVGHTIVADTSENEYTIVDIVDSTKIQISASATADSTDTFTITATGDYRLPATVRRIDSRMTYAAGSGQYQEVMLINEANIRSYRQQNNVTGRPVYAALVPLNYDAVTVGAEPRTDVFTGTRYDLGVWKTPDADYTMTFMAMIIPDLLSSSNLYPMGGPSMSDVYLAGVLAEVESRIDDKGDGSRQNEFERLLAAALERDKRVSAPLYQGRNVDLEDVDLVPGRHLIHQSLTVNGVEQGS